VRSLHAICACKLKCPRRYTLRVERLGVLSVCEAWFNQAKQCEISTSKLNTEG
jgi:hypothetical protein